MARPGPDDLTVALSRVPMPGPWARRGRCRNVASNMFFPTVGEDIDQARAICAQCPVQSECLEYALPVPGLRGVWGGTSERERRQLREAATASQLLPPASRRQGFRSPRGSLYAALEELAAVPGHWARVAHFDAYGSAHATASMLRTGRRRVPPGRWQFEGRNVEGGSDLYAMLEAEDQAS